MPSTSTRPAALSISSTWLKARTSILRADCGVRSRNRFEVSLARRTLPVPAARSWRTRASIFSGCVGMALSCNRDAPLLLTMLPAIARIANPMFRSVFSAIVGYFVSRCPRNRVRVTYADGSRRDFYAGGGEPEIEIRFRTARAERRAVLQFYQGLVEAYIDEEVDFIGDQPFRRLVEMADVILENPTGRRGWGAALFGKNPIVYAKQLLQELRQNNTSVAQAKQNAIHHYGLAPEFFGYLLGDTVGYSEGYWPEGTETLDQAKHNIYDYVARKLRLEPGHKVIEVGAGWGYMPMLMAREYGADVTVYNPVPRQNDYMRARFARHGLGDAIHLFEKDHRDLKDEPNAYDRYVSIGVYEHVGKDGYRDWIESIATALKPGGLGLISTTAKMRREMTG